MEHEVAIPAGCGPGSEILVDVGGRQYFVTVPEGSEGSFVVTLPAEEHGVEVVVPDGCSAGDQFVVQLEEGELVEAEVPPGCSAGDTILIHLPTPARGAAADEDDEADEAERRAELTGSSSETDSSSESSAEPESEAKFAVGLPVEVMRTDGLWTLATVVEYEPEGATYTVQLADGRYKYFVEPDYLRIPGFLLQSSAMI